jgi:hypothetical protein
MELKYYVLILVTFQLDFIHCVIQIQHSENSVLQGWAACVFRSI